ncbi:MAG TPA: peptidylprolyl isomerase [Albitalea sp.]|uniref:peptidylprolyl isomerase n=1 Tax=Piscinibacter sp. TaxID=1903157 RepID=UPI002ED4C69B
MTEDSNPIRRAVRRHTGPLLMAAAACIVGTPALAQTTTPAPARSVPRTADYIVAIVNQELVTASELEQRMARVRENATRAGQKLPDAAELRKQVLDALIDERVQVTHARDNGNRVDDAELDRAVANVAVQNQVTMTQLRQRLAAEGLDYGRFRNNIRDQIMVERLREREVQARIRITDEEVDNLLDKQRAKAGAAIEYNIAQILVSVPDGASDAAVAERRARIDAALARVRAGEAFEAVAREVSEDGNKAQGGVIGMRAADRLPDVFVSHVRALKPGEVSPTVLRTGAGFHVLKLIERREGSAFSIAQTHARHILLRTSPQLSQEAAIRRLAEFKREIAARTKSFEQLARENSEDGSAAQGGDLGWAFPGQFVPEFEETMNALAAGGVSEPVVSRFGVHLIQVIERRQVSLDAKQQREQARNVLREQKFEQAYLEWLRELRARAYIEMREAPT